MSDEETKALLNCAEWLACEVSGHGSKCTCGSCYAVAKAAPLIQAAYARTVAERLRARLLAPAQGLTGA